MADYGRTDKCKQRTAKGPQIYADEADSGTEPHNDLLLFCFRTQQDYEM
jgi:hypothetical protein